MPFIIAGVVKSMALSFLGNSGVIEKTIILLLETLSKTLFMVPLPHMETEEVHLVTLTGI